MKTRLLSRDEFRQSVFQRDGHRCVFCGAPAQDAHHIIERRLWDDGGYYIDNGASVCETHHRACERTDITPDEVRSRCGITSVILPEHLYPDQKYDKWGNIVLSSGSRLRGELFFHESVQKVIEQHLAEFSDVVRYPRTYHLPWSEHVDDDDRMMRSAASFIGKRVIVTEKMDGENTTMHRDLIYAWQGDTASYPSGRWMKQFWATISYDIPDGWRICGENLWTADDSIRYEHLPSCFLGFSLWNEKNECLSWEETVEWFELLGIAPVAVLYDGLYDEARVRELSTPELWARSAGYVMRLAEPFTYGRFKESVGKYVRKNHMQAL